MAWVYILKTKSADYYVGSTRNISARLTQHESKQNFTTRRLGVESLALKQEYRTIDEARSIERKIKKFKRRDYIEKMIKDGYIKLLP